MSSRADVLADRILAGADALAQYATQLSDQQWRTKIPPDGRTAGVIVHHVASMYPIEVDLAQQLAGGTNITNVSWQDVAAINAAHAVEHAGVTRAEALDLLQHRSREAADRVRRFTDAQLDGAATLSLNAHAPVTAQFMIEGHAVAHSFHHLARLRAVRG